jgi:hypothetical protein
VYVGTDKVLDTINDPADAILPERDDDQSQSLQARCLGCSRARIVDGAGVAAEFDRRAAKARRAWRACPSEIPGDADAAGQPDASASTGESPAAPRWLSRPVFDLAVQGRGSDPRGF